MMECDDVNFSCHSSSVHAVMNSDKFELKDAGGASDYFESVVDQDEIFSDLEESKS